MSKYNVGSVIPVVSYKEESNRGISETLFGCVFGVLFAVIAIWLLFITAVEALPPTKAELNCEIETPVCSNGVLLEKYSKLK